MRWPNSKRRWPPSRRSLPQMPWLAPLPPPGIFAHCAPINCQHCRTHPPFLSPPPPPYHTSSLLSPHVRRRPPQSHAKKLDEMREALARIGRQIQAKERENARLDDEIRELGVAVAERKKIHEVQSASWRTRNATHCTCARPAHAPSSTHECTHA